MRVLIVFSCLVVAACGGQSEPPSRAESADGETVFEPLTETLDRARGVEDTLRQRAEELRQRAEDDDE